MNAAVLLRQKVLDLAIRGKLTKRDEGDEPATSLLARIAAKKEERSAKAGRVRVPATPQPITDEETPFELPKGWVWCRLRILGEFFGGHTPSLSNLEFWEKGNVLWVTSKDMKTKYIEDTGVKVSRKGAAELKLLPVGAVLMVTRSGILRRTFPVALAAKPLTINQDQRALVLYEPLMSEYVYVLLKALEPIILKDYRKTGTTVESILWEKFIDMPIPLPPLAEQKRIVERIDELFEAIDQYSAAMGKISNAASLMEKKVLDLAIRGKLSKQEKSDGLASEIIEEIVADKAKLIAKKQMRREKTLPPIMPDEQPFELPHGWAWARLGQLVQLTSGQDLTPNRYNDNKKGIPYLTGASNIQDGNVIINRWTQTPTSCAEKGDLLFTCKGTVGRMAVLNEKKVHIARQIMGLKAWGGINLTYIQYCLTTMVAGLQSIARSMIPGIGRDDLLNKVIPLPPLAEQKRIVERVDAILAECRKVSR